METKGIRLIHNIYSMTIENYSLLDRTDNLNLIKRVKVWMPKKYLASQLLKFRISVNEYFNEDKLLSDINKINLREIYYNEITLYQSLYYSLTLGKHEDIKELVEWFRKKYNKEPDDLHCILRSLEVAQSRYNSIKEIETEPKSFENTIISLEMILDLKSGIDRKAKLYKLKEYIDLAEEKIKIMESNRDG